MNPNYVKTQDLDGVIVKRLPLAEPDFETGAIRNLMEYKVTFWLVGRQETNTCSLSRKRLGSLHRSPRQFTTSCCAYCLLCLVVYARLFPLLWYWTNECSARQGF